MEQKDPNNNNLNQNDNFYNKIDLNNNDNLTNNGKKEKISPELYVVRKIMKKKNKNASENIFTDVFENLFKEGSSPERINKNYWKLIKVLDYIGFDPPRVKFPKLKRKPKKQSEKQLLLENPNQNQLMLTGPHSNPFINPLLFPDPREDEERRKRHKKKRGKRKKWRIKILTKP